MDDTYNIESYLKHWPAKVSLFCVDVFLPCLSHVFSSRALQNQVLIKWEGYPESDATWRNIRGEDGIIQEISLKSHLEYLKKLHLSRKRPIDAVEETDTQEEEDDAESGVFDAPPPGTPVPSTSSPMRSTSIDSIGNYDAGLVSSSPTVLFPLSPPPIGAFGSNTSELLLSAAEAADAAELSSTAAMTSARASAASAKNASRLVRMAMDAL